MNGLDHPHLGTSPNTTRPLLGLTVLVVEDSLYACEALRMLCLKSGARIRRADCLRSARRHLRVYRPSVAIIDLGLPDGSGVELIEDLTRGHPRPPVVLAISGDPHRENLARAAGADGFFEKPILSLAAFQSRILSLLPEDQRPRGPRTVSDEVIQPDLMAFQDDMAHAADILGEEAGEGTVDYVAQFLAGVARSARDADLAEAADRLANRRADGAPIRSNLAEVAGLVQERLAGKMAI